MQDSSRYYPSVMFQAWLCMPGKGSLRMISGGVSIAVSTMRVGSRTWYVEKFLLSTFERGQFV